jgi:hypothetical protein
MFILKPVGGAVGEYEASSHWQRYQPVHPLWRQFWRLGVGQPDLP